MLSQALSDALNTKLQDVAVTIAGVQQVYHDAQIKLDADGLPILRLKYRQIAPVTVLVGAQLVTYEVHEYDGLQGKGWILHATATVLGKIYHRQQDFGPEGRTKGWEQVT